MHKLFIAEGDKICREYLDSGLQPEGIFALKEWYSGNRGVVNIHSKISNEVTIREMEKMSALSEPSPVLLLIRIPQREFDYLFLRNSHTLVLDQITDPGNLGTIIRTADWFGIKNLICSDDCVDLYNPKVVQASMGSMIRVRVFYFNLVSFLTGLNKMVGKPIVYGSDLTGSDILKVAFPETTLVILGNESNGIRKDIYPFINDRVTITGKGGAQSLNVASAAAVICHALNRQKPLQP